MTRGGATTDYISNIDTTLYAQHAFRLPRMGKISSNPTEQSNSCLLGIHEFASFKIILEGYYYIQQKFNDRMQKALESRDILTKVALERHSTNLCNCGAMGGLR